MSYTVELDERTAAVIQELAATENRSVGEVIRDALNIYTEKSKRTLPKGAGKYRSGHTDTSQTVDALLNPSNAVISN